jgi:dTMP kinase
VVKLFFVIEGTDGAGCGAQRKAVSEKLIQTGIDVMDIKYPFYGSPVGEMIHEFLHGKIKLTPEMQFLLYATNMVEDKQRISQAVDQGKIVIADRYITSSFVYQSLRGFPMEKMLEFAKIFGMHVPKAVFLLDVPSEVAMKRKLAEEGKEELDINERDKEFMEKVRKEYLEIAKDNIFTKWIVVDGTKTIEEIRDEIVGHIRGPQ